MIFSAFLAERFMMFLNDILKFLDVHTENHSLLIHRYIGLQLKARTGVVKEEGGSIIQTFSQC